MKRIMKQETASYISVACSGLDLHNSINGRTSSANEEDTGSKPVKHDPFYFREIYTLINEEKEIIFMNEFEKAVLSIRLEATKECLKVIAGALLMSVGIYIVSDHSAKVGYHLGCANTLERVGKAFSKHE